MTRMRLGVAGSGEGDRLVDDAEPFGSRPSTGRARGRLVTGGGIVDSLDRRHRCNRVGGRGRCRYGRPGGGGCWGCRGTPAQRLPPEAWADERRRFRFRCRRDHAASTGNPDQPTWTTLGRCGCHHRRRLRRRRRCRHRAARCRGSTHGLAGRTGRPLPSPTVIRLVITSVTGHRWGQPGLPFCNTQNLGGDRYIPVPTT